MKINMKRFLILLGCALVLDAVVVPASAEALPPPEAVATADYSPMFYSGYVVYFDDYGMPYYYVEGRPARIPASYVHYDRMVHHYRGQRVRYHRWHQRHGYRWTAYRYLPPEVSYYNPLYHDGYVVYYDDIGRPYYYVNSTIYYIASTYVNYHRYTNHYRTYRPHYTRWYRSHGPRYRTYRQSGYHRSRPAQTQRARRPAPAQSSRRPPARTQQAPRRTQRRQSGNTRDDKQVRQPNQQRRNPPANNQRSNQRSNENQSRSRRGSRI